MENEVPILRGGRRIMVNGIMTEVRAWKCEKCTEIYLSRIRADLCCGGDMEDANVLLDETGGKDGN